MSTKVKEKKDTASKRVPEGLQQLCNENQETIFDNDLSIAADNHAKAVKESSLWKERLINTKKELIKQMKDKKHLKIRMGEDKIIQYKFTAAKEDIILKDYKAKSPRRRGGRF